MKNKSIIYIVGSMLLVIMIVICYFARSTGKSIDTSIMNKTWYNYDYMTGYYNTFYLDTKKMTYKNPSSKNSYANCTNYTYNKNSNIINLNCGKKIIVEKVNDNNVVLTIDSKKTVFYDNIDDTLNYEFENYFNKSISEYKKEMNRVTDIIKIDYNRFIELFKADEYSKLIFIGNNCTTVDCALSLDVIEKWITKTENVYFINIDDFSDKQLKNIKNINQDFIIDRVYYNDIYPKIVITKNSKIVDQYEIKCDGFNCTKYIDNEF